MDSRTSKILTVAVPDRLQKQFKSHRLAYSVLASSSAEDALSLIETENIQLCVLNDELPDMERFIRSVRSTPWGAELPLLVITSTKTHEELFKLGADAFFSTGDSNEQFLEKIELLLGLSDTNRTNDFFSRAEQDDPYHHALEYAEQLVDGMEGGTSPESLRVLPSNETLQSLVAKVEMELRGQLVGMEVDDNVEGLEAVEPQAYIGHQLSVGERMASDGRDSAYDVIVQSESKREPKSGVSSTPPVVISPQNAENVERGNALSMSDEPNWSNRRVRIENQKGDTLSQPFRADTPSLKESEPVSPDERFVVREQISVDTYERGISRRQYEPNDARLLRNGDIDVVPSAGAEKDEGSGEFMRRVPPRADALPPASEQVTSKHIVSSDVLHSEMSHADMLMKAGDEKARSPILSTAEFDGKASGTQEGRLESVPLWRIFISVMKNRLSGRLLVKSREIERQVFFDSGNAVVVYSNAKDDRLVELLFREGRISQRQYEHASMTIATSGRRAGVVMVEKGIITARELFPVVRYHYESILFDMFGWTEGSWKFVSEPYQLKERIQLDSKMTDIILDAFRNYVPKAQIAQLVPADAMVKIPDGGAPFNETYLSAKELELLEWCNGNRSVRWLATRLSVDITEVQAVMAGLGALGWLDTGTVSPGAFSVLSLPGEEDGDGTPSEDQLDIRHETTRINDKYMQVEEGTYFDIAEVPPDASAYEIRKSLQRLKSLYSPKRYVGLQITDLQEKLSIIGSVLDEAGDVLFNEELREQYRQTLL